MNLARRLALTASLVLATTVAHAQTIDRGEVGAMITWLNEARAERGVPPLAGDARLHAIAEAHSVDMASHGFFAHQSPTTGGPGDRAARAGLVLDAWAENIAINRTPRAAFDALMRSPGHYANIMNPGLRSVGIGLVRGRDGVYVTQSFGTFRHGAGAGAVVAAPRVPAVVAVPNADRAEDDGDEGAEGDEDEAADTGAGADEPHGSAQAGGCDQPVAAQPHARPAAQRPTQTQRGPVVIAPPVVAEAVALLRRLGVRPEDAAAIARAVPAVIDAAGRGGALSRVRVYVDPARARVRPRS